jgi:hypothetical protein
LCLLSFVFVFVFVLSIRVYDPPSVRVMTRHPRRGLFHKLPARRKDGKT